MADPAGTSQQLMHAAAHAYKSLLAATLFSAVLLASPSRADNGPEALLNQVFDAISQNKLDVALTQVESLLRSNPNFRLANLIKGDLLIARARPLRALGDAPNAPRERLEDLRAEAIARLKAYRERPPADKVPRYILEMQPEQRYAVVVDAERARLFLYQNVEGIPRLVADYYISAGKRGMDKIREGDEKTPIGVYYVTANLPRSKLSDFYGSGAFPISYPNEWDKRLGRNGHGIWLHGTPSDTFSRPPRASNGCVVLSNRDLDALAKTLQVGLTPVIISEKIEWQTVTELAADRKALKDAIEQWRADWESRDTLRYLQHYSKKFSSGTQDFSAWAKHKETVNAGKDWIKVGVTGVSMFRSPGQDLVVVSFEQDYRSNNLANNMKKRQYWSNEGGHWRIVYEGAA
jgi:murein L,D-transpeptidase YafK